MEYAKRGAAALDSSDGLSAAAFYTKALIEHPSSPDYFTQRSIAFTRSKPPRHDLALRDAEYAVLLAQKRQKREKIQAAQQRRVVSSYGLGRYDEAKQILDMMLRWRPKDGKKEKMEHDMWMTRIMSKIKGKEAGIDTAKSVKEYPEIDLPNETNMKRWLQGQLRNDGTFRFEEEEDTINSDKPSIGSSDPAENTTFDIQDEADVNAGKIENATAQQPIKTQAVRHDWYQDVNFVTITFYAKKVDKTKLEANFSDDYVRIAFPHPDAVDQDFLFELDPTCASIDASASTSKVLGTKVEIKLSKKEKGVKWAALDDKSRPKTDKLPSAWVTKGDDWDKKAAELTKKKPKKKDGGTGDGSDEDSDYGGDAVDGFFKKLYAGADDDTRRAMMKSFQESNGTALSTNWSEVGKGPVEEVKSKSD